MAIRIPIQIAVLGVFLSLAANTSAAANISTVAGTGFTTYNGDGIAATVAQLAYQGGIYLDASGNTYIADTANDRVRRVDGATGLIATVAGTGFGGYNGDGIAATAAQLRSPMDVFVDVGGALYIADYMNHRVRRIDTSTGLISTVAGTGSAGYSGDGGSATAAKLNYPFGIVVDSSGNIYICDSMNNRVRMVDASTGLISTAAGTGTAGYNMDGILATAAQLSQPTGIAIDASGTIYIADLGNNRIRVVDPISKIINTIAGTGTYGYNTDGIAATSADLAWPVDVYVDAERDIYIADRDNLRVRKVTHGSWLISTVAGSGATVFNGDRIIATDANLYMPFSVFVNAGKDLFISDRGNNRIRMVDPLSGLIDTVAGLGTDTDGLPATNSTLNYPRGIAFDISGHIYVSEKGTDRIRRIDAVTRIIDTVAGTGAQGYNADGIEATAALLADPHGLAVDGQMNVYIADNLNNRVRKVQASSGLIGTVAGNGLLGVSGDGMEALSGPIYNPSGVELDPTGNFYIAETGNHAIRRVDALTGILSTVAGVLNVPGYNGDGIEATEAHLYFPYDFKMDLAGNIWIADTWNSRIRRVDAITGMISTVAGTGTIGYNSDGIAATAAHLSMPRGVAVDRAGNLYIADSGNSRIRRVDAATGIISTIAGTGTGGYNGDGIEATTAQLNIPYGLIFDSAGDLFIADMANNRIRKVSLGIAALSGPALEISGELSKGDLLVAPNVLDRSTGGSLVIYVRGDPNGNAEVEIFDETGDYVGSLDAQLDSTGFGQVSITGGMVDGKRLGPGVYWALCRGDGVKDKKRFMVVSR